MLCPQAVLQGGRKRCFIADRQSAKDYRVPDNS
ncbi:hypothetical protein T10_2630 [Trichinella papuae]|uniref:Uncharacterized protein n=1 Tax=Trichinella papuae TaxID=268474 RepID=A0A0V1MDP9_9BILA|nr:hypothetical protein T10_2630 [Trichinella papuae]